MKKAFLVGFAPLTRVILDVPENFEPIHDKGIAKDIINKAKEQIIQNAGDKLNIENCDRLEEDTECPYKEGEDIEPEDIIKKVFETFTKTGTLEIDDLPEDEFEVPCWTFFFEDDNEAKSLELKTIYDTPDPNDFIFEWEAPGYSEMEKLSEMEYEKIEYIAECFENLNKSE